MSKERASLGFGSELDDLDLTAFPAEPKARPSAEATEAAAKAAGFKSREPKPVKAPAPPPSRPVDRRYRTGRSVQFNVRAKQETIDAFTRIVDAKGWTMAVTFEEAVELLVREYGSKS